MSNNSSGGSFSLIGFILGIMLLWATCCGVTYHGVHYGISCSCDKGVTVSP